MVAADCPPVAPPAGSVMNHDGTRPLRMGCTETTCLQYVLLNKR